MPQINEHTVYQTVLVLDTDLKICVRNGQVCLLEKMNGESKQPQLEPIKTRPDPQALRNPRPEQNLAEQRALQYGFNPVGFLDIPGITPDNNLVSTGSVGEVTVTTT